MALLRLSHAQPSYQPQATVMRMSTSELAAGADLLIILVVYPDLGSAAGKIC
jgi:hypothetical protein